MILPTWRLALAALAGVVPTILAPSHDVALLVAILWLGTCALIGVADALLLPDRHLLRWERIHGETLPLADRSPVELVFRNGSRRDLQVRLRDAVPVTMEPERNMPTAACPGGAEWRWTYTVLPKRRGEYRLGPLTVRYRGPLGFAWRQMEVPLEGKVKVYPNLGAISRYEALLRRGELQAMGIRAVRTPDIGTEFDRLREYTHDDEFRRINWPATARLHRPIAADYQTERSQTIMLALDAGRLMGVHVPAHTGGFPVALNRLDYVISAALLLAYVSERFGDRVGVVAFSDRVCRHVGPRSGRRQFVALTEALYNLEAEEAETDYGVGLGYLAAESSRRSLVILFTDLWEPEATSTLVAQVRHLARRHLPMVVSLRDPEMERMAEMPLDGSESVYRRAIARDMLDERAAILRRLEAGGVLTLDVTAGELSPAIINRYLEIKGLGRL